MFHIIDEAPSARHRRSFWVSRLNEDGTDSDIGAIPNSSRAQEWLDEQGEGILMIQSNYKYLLLLEIYHTVIISGILLYLGVSSEYCISFQRVTYQCMKRLSHSPGQDLS